MHRWYNPNEQLVRFVGAPAPAQLLVAPGFQTIKTDSNQTRQPDKWLRQLTLPVVQKNF